MQASPLPWLHGKTYANQSRKWSPLKHALLGKQVMRIIQMKDTSISKALIAKYRISDGDTSFKLLSNSSTIWRNLYVVIDPVKENLWWRIGNGEAVTLNYNFWFQPTKPNSSYFKARDLMIKGIF